MRRYNPDGKYKTSLWVNAQGNWLLGDKLPVRNDWQGGWQRVVIEISDILKEHEVRGLIQSVVNDAPRIRGLINFTTWRWWQACLKEEEEEEEEEESTAR